MDTEGQEDDLLHALSPYKPAARLAFATDVVKSIVRIPTKGPSSRIWRTIYPIPTKQKRALPVKAHKDPLPMSGLKKLVLQLQIVCYHGSTRLKVG
jgi:hypothetical protein